MKPLNNKMFFFVFLGIFSSFQLLAQVGIGTTNPQGALDINGAFGGLVLPRTDLSSLTDTTTITNPLGGAPAEGTVVYNLGTDIVAGFYFYDGTAWVNLISEDDFLGKSDQTLREERTIDASNHDLIVDIAPDGSTGLQIELDHFRLSRDPGNIPDGYMSSRNSMVFGIDNNENTVSTEYFAWGENGSVTDGTSDSDYVEYMRLNDTGLGVGTDPQYAMHVAGASGNNIAKFEAPDYPIFGGFIVEDNSGNNTTKFVISPGNIANNNAAAMSGVPAGNSNGQNSVTIDLEGSTYDIYTFMEGVIRPGYNGLTSLGTSNHRFANLYLQNNPDVSSDIRLKEFITEIDYGLETVMQITPVSYEMIADSTNRVHLGFKAQELQEIVPEIVNVAPDTELLSVAYAEMIPVLTKAIQELNDKVDSLIEDNASLRASNAELLEHLNKN